MSQREWRTRTYRSEFAAAAESNGTDSRERPLEERLVRRLRSMLKPNPRGALLTGGRSFSDEDFVVALAGFLARRIEDGTLTEAGVAEDMTYSNRSTLWRNLQTRLGVNYRELVRIVQEE